MHPTMQRQRLNASVEGTTLPTGRSSDAAAFSWQGLPSKVVMASGAIDGIAAEADALNMKRVLLVSGARTARSRAGMNALTALGSRVAARFDAVPPHSGEQVVHQGAELARASGVDGIVAIGGGSASDTVKAIAILLAEGGRIADHANVFYPPDRYDQKILGKRKLPLIVVPTTASAAEVTPGLGIRGDDGKKLVFWDPNVVPRTIILDPEACLDTPIEVMAATAMNAFAHCVEGLYSRVKNPISTGLALHAAGILSRAIPAMVSEPQEESHRAAVLVGAHLSGHVIANARVGLHHAICHGLGSHGGLSHGDANAIMLPHVMRYNAEAALEELARLATALGEDVRVLSTAAAADRAIEAVERLQERAHVPRRLRDAGFDRSLIAPIARMTLSDRGAYFNPIVGPPVADIEAIIGGAW